MGVDGGQGIEVTQGNRDVGGQEPEQVETQRKILERVLEILKDPRAVTLTYPSEDVYGVAVEGLDPQYENGTQIRFAMLSKPRRLGRDEICVAIANNVSKHLRRVLGAGLTQALENKKMSDREIGVIRFEQTPYERLRGNGTVTKIGLSDTDQTYSGTFSIKGRAIPHRMPPHNAPTFAERWESGNIQLHGLDIYHSFIQGSDVLPSQDYPRLLLALNEYQLDTRLTTKVVENQKKMDLVRISHEPIDLAAAGKPLAPGNSE